MHKYCFFIVVWVILPLAGLALVIGGTVKIYIFLTMSLLSVFNICSELPHNDPCFHQNLQEFSSLSRRQGTAYLELRSPSDFCLSIDNFVVNGDSAVVTVTEAEPSLCDSISRSERGLALSSHTKAYEEDKDGNDAEEIPGCVPCPESNMRYDQVSVVPRISLSQRIQGWLKQVILSSAQIERVSRVQACSREDERLERIPSVHDEEMKDSVVDARTASEGYTPTCICSCCVRLSCILRNIRKK